MEEQHSDPRWVLKKVGEMPKETIARQQLQSDEPEWTLDVRWLADRHVQVAAHKESEFDSGQFFTLDRDQINAMIKALRKARDKAYGADA